MFVCSKVLLMFDFLRVDKKDVSLHNLKNFQITSLQVHPKYQPQAPAAGAAANPLKEIENILLRAISDTGDLVSDARAKIKRFISQDVPILSNSNFDHVGKLIVDKKKEFRTVLRNLLSKDNFNELAEQLEQKFGREALLNLEYDVRSMVQKYQKNHKGASNKLNNLISSLTKEISNIKIPVNVPAAQTTETKPKYPAPTKTLFPLDPNNPISPQDQLMLQYVVIIVGGALILAL